MDTISWKEETNFFPRRIFFQARKRQSCETHPVRRPGDGPLSGEQGYFGGIAENELAWEDLSVAGTPGARPRLDAR